MNTDESKAEGEAPLVRPTLPDVPDGELTAEHWYAYKAQWRHYDFERLRRGLITREQFDQGNSLAKMCGNLRELMKNAHIDYQPSKHPDFLQRMADERASAVCGDGKTGDGGNP